MRIVVGCGKAKRDHPTSADDLYTSAYFRCAIAWAKSVVPRDNVWIMSAKYGMVPAARVIAPYSASLSTAGFARTSEPLEPPIPAHVLAQQCMNWRDPVIMLAGKKYYRLLNEAAPHLHPYNPFLPLLTDRRQGYQAQQMKQHHGRIPGMSAA